MIAACAQRHTDNLLSFFFIRFGFGASPGVGCSLPSTAPSASAWVASSSLPSSSLHEEELLCPADCLATRVDAFAAARSAASRSLASGMPLVPTGFFRGTCSARFERSLSKRILGTNTAAMAQ